MARPEAMTVAEWDSIMKIPLPELPPAAWCEGPPLSRRRVAIVTTAGLHRPDDRPFGIGAGRASDFPGDYRVIPADTDPATLLMSHISVNFDRTGFQRDWNVVFPLARLTELAAAGVIGSVAGYHYSFMGAAPPEPLEQPARRLAGLLRGDAVDAVLLVPV